MLLTTEITMGWETWTALLFGMDNKSKNLERLGKIWEGYTSGIMP